MLIEPKWMKEWHGRVLSPEDAVAFINAVGFCTIDYQDLENFPFLAAAFPGERDSVLGETWFWKDDLHNEKKAYYTRLFASKPGFISMELLPAFIATNGEAADEIIMMGRMPAATKEIYSIIEREGPISTKDLKKIAGKDTAKKSANILIELERKFIITKVGLTGRVRENYGYIWDLAERWLPDAFEKADELGVKKARELIIERLKKNGIKPTTDFLMKAFGWNT